MLLRKREQTIAVSNSPPVFAHRAGDSIPVCRHGDATAAGDPALPGKSACG